MGATAWGDTRGDGWNGLTGQEGRFPREGGNLNEEEEEDE